MKRFLLSFTFIIIFAIMLAFPSHIFQGASNGLLLWFNTVFPTLFPFMIISSIIVRTNTLSIIAGLTGSVFQHIFHVSHQSSFAILGGFLCGYPMGAKITADLIQSNNISKEEGSYLLSFCNNTSPMFSLSFILLKYTKAPELVLPGMLILIISPLLCSQLFYFSYYKNKLDQIVYKSSANKSSKPIFRILDECIMKSMESIVQVGGYIIVFSVLIELIRLIPYMDADGKAILLSLLEITNGITIINGTKWDFEIQWIFSLSLASFGGFCAAAQTSCMINESGLSMRPYIIEKLITASVTSLLAIFYLIVW